MKLTERQLAHLRKTRTFAPPAVERSEPLYRFMRFGTAQEQQTVRAVLVDQRLRFARPREFNDPFDCQPHLMFSTSAEQSYQEHFEAETRRIVIMTYPADKRAQSRMESELRRFSADQLLQLTEERVRTNLLDTQRLLCCG
jgi:hypothetical protein